MSITVYDRFGKEQGTYDKNSHQLALFDGGFTGELFEYNNTRIGIVEYGGRFKLDSTTINASSSGSSDDFGTALGFMGALAFIGIVFVGPLFLGGALTGAILSKNKRDVTKWLLVSIGVLSVFWFSFAYSAYPDSMFAIIGFLVFFIIAFMCVGSTLTFQKHIEPKLAHFNWFIKWLSRSILSFLWMIPIIVVAEITLGYLPLYVAHPAWMNPFQSEKSALATVKSLQDIQTKIFGPTKGSILHTPDDNSFAFASSDMLLRDFIVEVQVRNPSKADIYWIYGINFRQTYETDNAYFLYIDSDKDWRLEIDRRGDWNDVGSGDIENLNLSPNGLNKIYLVIRGKTGYLFVNDDFVTKLDVAGNQHQGNVMLFVGNEYEGEKTIYENFTIWSLDD